MTASSATAAARRIAAARSDRLFSFSRRSRRGASSTNATAGTASSRSHGCAKNRSILFTVIHPPFRQQQRQQRQGHQARRIEYARMRRGALRLSARRQRQRLIDRLRLRRPLRLRHQACRRKHTHAGAERRRVRRSGHTGIHRLNGTHGDGTGRGDARRRLRAADADLRHSAGRRPYGRCEQLYRGGH